MTIKLALRVSAQGPPRVLHLRSQETISFWHSVQVKLKFSISAALFDLRMLEEALISTPVIQSEVIQNIWRCGTSQQLHYMLRLWKQYFECSYSKPWLYKKWVVQLVLNHSSAFLALTLCICVLKQLEETRHVLKINLAISLKHKRRKQIRAAHPLRCDALDLIFCLN